MEVSPACNSSEAPDLPRLQPHLHARNVAGRQPVGAEVLLDRHGVARMQAEVTGGAPDLAPDLAIVEVQDHRVRPTIQTHYLRRHVPGLAAGEYLPTRCMAGSRGFAAGGVRCPRV